MDQLWVFSALLSDRGGKASGRRDWMSYHTGPLPQGLHIAFGVRYCRQKNKSANSPGLPCIPEHQYTLTIKGQLPRTMVPQTQVLLGSERQGWSATHRKLEAGIQQGIMPSRIPGYAPKTGWPFSSWLVSLMPDFPSSAHLAEEQLLMVEEGVGLHRNVTNLSQGLLVPSLHLCLSHWLLFGPVLTAAHQHTCMNDAWC